MQVDSGGGSGVELDFDLNLAPIIDCFTVLITFLLISASALSLQVIEASVASVEVSTEPAAPAPGISVTVMTKIDGSYEVIVSGDENRSVPIPAASDALSRLEQSLVELQTKWKETKTITVSGEENVEYKDIVRVMEMGRKHFSTILMGGF
jgi:biopolymer transport protein ExbD